MLGSGFILTFGLYSPAIAKKELISEAGISSLPAFDIAFSRPA